MSRKALKKILVVFLSLMIPLQMFSIYVAPRVSAQSPLDSAYSFAGSITQCQLSQSATNLQVAGTIGSSLVPQITSVSAYVVQIYEDETGLDFSTRTPFYTQSSGFSSSFSFSVPLSQLNDADSPYGVVFTSKVAVVITKSDGSKQLVDFAKYITNPGASSVNTAPFPTQKSIKGVGLLIPSDLEQLGVQFTSINVLLWNMLTLSDHGSSSIAYSFEGQTYYFKKDYISTLDNTLRTCWANGIAMYAILIMNNSANGDSDSPAQYLAHPDGGSSTGLVAVNMTDANGVRYYKAIMSFLSGRYNGSQGYGRFDGYIVGNEIGASTAWNCMGNKTLNDYVDQYCRWLRLTNSIVKQGWSNARVYASFDHLWNSQVQQSNFVSYKNRDLIDALENISKLQGDFDWNITWHPYPENIYNPATWNDADATTGNDTQYVTFKNLEVLSNYMQQSNYLYNGSMRHIILSEEGFNSSDNSTANQQLQAAAYAYAYYKVLCTPGVDMFSMNGEIDNSQEMNLSLGLWTAKPGTVNQAYQKKAIYDVFQKIDTVDSLNVTQFALGVIGNSMGTTITSWSQLISNFSTSTITAACNRPARAAAPAGAASGLTGAETISANSIASWSASDDTGSLALQNDSGLGQNVATATILGGLYATNIPKDYKGLTYAPAAALNLSSKPVISVDVKVTGIGAGKQADFVLRAYSGDKVMESAVYTAPAEQWNTVAMDLTGFSGISSVDRIKVWVRPHDDNTLLSGTVSVNNLKKYTSGTISNLVVTTDVSSVQKAGQTVQVTVANNGNTSVSENAPVSGVNGLTTNISSQALSLSPLQAATFPVAITVFRPTDYMGGILRVTVQGTAHDFALTTPRCADYVQDGQKLDLGEFESGLADGWAVGTNANVAYVVTNSYETHQNPPAASQGTYFLNVQRGPYVATTPAYITKTFRKSMDLSGYNNISFDFNGYGGASTSYTVQLVLTSMDGTSQTYSMTYNAVYGYKWDTYSVDISGFAGRRNLKSISIGFKGNDTAYYGGNWMGWFSIDNVYAQPSGGAGGDPYLITAYPDFSNASANALLNLTGRNSDGIPVISSNILHLSPNGSGHQVGYAFYNQKITLDTDRSFSTAFKFKITPGSMAADGFVFTLSNSVNAYTGSYTAMGFPTGVNDVGIEFDTYANWDHGDPSNNHIGLDINGSPVSVQTLNLNGTGITLADGVTKYAWVDYDGATHTLTATVSNSNVRSAGQTMTASVDLSNVLSDGAVYAGFTAAHYGSGEQHDIQSWYFESCDQTISSFS